MHCSSSLPAPHSMQVWLQNFPSYLFNVPLYPHHLESECALPCEQVFGVLVFLGGG